MGKSNLTLATVGLCSPRGKMKPISLVVWLPEIDALYILWL